VLQIFLCAKLDFLKFWPVKKLECSGDCSCWKWEILKSIGLKNLFGLGWRERVHQLFSWFLNQVRSRNFLCWAEIDWYCDWFILECEIFFMVCTKFEASDFFKFMYHFGAIFLSFCAKLQFWGISREKMKFWKSMGYKPSFWNLVGGNLLFREGFGIIWFFGANEPDFMVKLVTDESGHIDLAEKTFLEGELFWKIIFWNVRYFLKDLSVLWTLAVFLNILHFWKIFRMASYFLNSRVFSKNYSRLKLAISEKLRITVLKEICLSIFEINVKRKDVFFLQFRGMKKCKPTWPV